MSEGNEVRVLDDFSRGRPERLNGVNCDIRNADVRNPTAVAMAMSGCDQVAHLAYLQGTQTFYAEPRQVLDVAVRGMLTVLDACAHTGCSDMLLVSSSEAYQVASEVPTPETVPLSVPDVLNPRYSYGGGKIACELMALAWQRTGVLDKLVIARPHNVYGPDMGWEHVIPEFCTRMNELTRLQASGIITFPIQGTGQETRSFCHVEDCTDQLAMLTKDVPSGIYHVGTQDEWTIADVAELTARYYGRDIKIEMGTLPQGSPPRRLPDTAKIEALLGNDPRVSFRQGLAETVDWYRHHAR